MIALRGNDSNTERIYRWRLEGSTNGDTFTTLYEAPNPTFVGSEVQYLPIETVLISLGSFAYRQNRVTPDCRSCNLMCILSN